MTVGYICPGWYNPAFGGPDPWANYYALVETRQRWSMSITRHAPWKLDVSLYEYFGVHLSPDAFQVLYNDAATIAR